MNDKVKELLNNKETVKSIVTKFVAMVVVVALFVVGIYVANAEVDTTREVVELAEVINNASINAEIENLSNNMGKEEAAIEEVTVKAIDVVEQENETVTVEVEEEDEAVQEVAKRAGIIGVEATIRNDEGVVETYNITSFKDVEEIMDKCNNGYYMSMENVNSHSGLSLDEIGYLLQPYEELRGLEGIIYRLDTEFGINAFFAIAVLRLESGNGQYTSGENNYFNITANSGEWVNYESKEACVEAFGNLIVNQYFTEGGKWYEADMIDGVSLKEMERHYCPFEELDPRYNTAEWIEYNEQFRWSYRVGNIMKELYDRVQ